MCTPLGHHFPIFSRAEHPNFAETLRDAHKSPFRSRRFIKRDSRYQQTCVIFFWKMSITRLTTHSLVTSVIDYIWRHSMFLGLFVLVLAAALFFATDEVRDDHSLGHFAMRTLIFATCAGVQTLATINDREESFVALKLHILVVCGLGVWCFFVFGTQCIRCGSSSPNCRTLVIASSILTTLA